MSTVANAAEAKRAVRHTDSVRDFNMQRFSIFGLLSFLTAELRALATIMEGSDEVACVVALAYDRTRITGTYRSIRLNLSKNFQEGTRKPVEDKTKNSCAVNRKL